MDRSHTRQEAMMSRHRIAVEPASIPSSRPIGLRPTAPLVGGPVPATHDRGPAAPVVDRALTPPAASTYPSTRSERVKVVLIGAGQAGLSVGYHLTRHGIPYVILDANERVGDSWRHRWDSLRLFTTARFDGLDGMPFPAPPATFPTKDEMADYLEAYAAHFRLPVRP